MLFSRQLYNYIRMHNKNLTKFKLTPNEEALFGTLITYKKELGLTTTMRVAGGWVRDKVLPSKW